MSLPDKTKPFIETETLKCIAAQQGVSLQASDLEPVINFLEVLLPQFDLMEEMVNTHATPATTTSSAKET